MVECNLPKVEAVGSNPIACSNLEVEVMGFFDKFLVKKIVSKEGKTHFRRWAIAETEFFNIYVHNVARSDEEKDPHDHPWSFVSLILKGGYREQVWTKGVMRTVVNTPGHLVIRRTTDFHKLTLLGDSAWTLVLTGPKVHALWGYQTAMGWIDHVNYRKRKNALRMVH